MNSIHWSIRATIVAVGLCASPLSFGAEDGGRWYIGGGLGVARDNDFDDSEPAGKFFGGYRVGKNFAAEASAAYLGTFGSGTLGIGNGGEFSKYSLSLQAVGILPIGQRVELLGKLGLSFWQVDADETCTVSAGRQVCVDDGTFDDGVDAVFGVGVQYQFGNRWSGRVEWERYTDVGEDDLDLLSIGVLYHF